MFYIIAGDDNFSCYKALQDIKKGLGDGDMLAVNTTVLDGRKLALKDLTEVCDAVPFMLPNRLVIVEGLLKRFQSGDKQNRAGEDTANDNNNPHKDWQDLASYIKRMTPTTVLVLFDPDLDSKGHNAFFKNLTPLADKVFQLNELKGKELQAWVRGYATERGGKMANSAIALLIEYMGGDLWALSGEIDKLATFCGDREITENDVREISIVSREENIFALVDSVLEGKVKDAQLMLHRMLKYGAAPQQILAMIERQLAVILRVKDMSHNTPLPQIKEKLGLHPRYPIEKTLRQAKSYSISRIRKAFHYLLEIDIAIKTGKYEDELALNLLVTELCRS
ncbi:MAG: DNA polymerase III subunit delta [Dehalococcoidia bacterium]|nr:DNA polymerase III subunit delta [Dehalococcoidia bacterium]MDD5493386.1 DNA polymerase III subunit delta [Dehalococcoidia bacterium]